MLIWMRQTASHALSIAFAVSFAAAQPLLLGSASQTPKTTGSASGSPVPCDEMNVKARGGSACRANPASLPLSCCGQEYSAPS
jgi:hypothetical protein